MNKPKNAEGSGRGTIAVNKRARYEYHIEERFEAGLSLQGWEVKSIRAGKLQFGDSYALINRGELYLFGAQISPLLSASSHVVPETLRNRKLLLHREEINRLIGAVERQGYTLIPLTVYWKAGKVKVELGLAKGKKLHDKRETEKNRDWDREKGRIMREHGKGKHR
jgi:SsrA-binding protein